MDDLLLCLTAGVIATKAPVRFNPVFAYLAQVATSSPDPSFVWFQREDAKEGCILGKSLRVAPNLCLHSWRLLLLHLEDQVKEAEVRWEHLRQRDKTHEQALMGRGLNCTGIHVCPLDTWVRSNCLT